MNKLILFIIMFIILLLILLNYKENFSSKLTYSINNKTHKHQAELYNVNQFTLIPDEAGNAVKLDGSSSYIEIPKLNLSNFTISCIFKQLNNNNQQVLFSSNTGDLVLKINNNKIQLSIEDDGDIKVFNSNIKILINKWIHLALTYDGENLRLFVDGLLEDVNIKSNIKINKLIFGGNNEHKKLFNGYIGQINLFNKKLNKNYLCNLHDFCELQSDLSKNDKLKLNKKSKFGFYLKTNTKKAYGLGKSINEIINDLSIQMGEVLTIDDFTEINLDSSNNSKSDSCNFIPEGITKTKCITNCIENTQCGPELCNNLCSNCEDPIKCPWIDNLLEAKCKFIPYGSTKVSCINKCIEDDECNYGDCQQICNSCDNVDTCSWVEPKKEKILDNLIEPPPIYDPEGKPLPPKISIKAYDGKVKINWFKPYEGNAPIESYIAYIFKTFNKKEGVKINMVPFPKCEDCVHVIDNLTITETYSVGIRAYNKFGLSKMSNIESFVPNEEIKEITPIIEDNIYEEYNICDA